MGFYLAFNKRNAQPEFTAAAAISGTPQVGETLTCSYTVAKAKPQNVTFEWHSYASYDGTEQDDSLGTLLGTAPTQTLTSDEYGKYIRLRITASNNAGTVKSYVYAAQTVLDPQPPPAITQQASITGTLVVGSILSVAFDFQNETSVTYAWKAATPGNPPTGETTVGTGSTYMLTSSEAGKVMRVTVTGANDYGSTPNTSEYTAEVTSGTGSFTTDPYLLLDSYGSYAAGEYINCECVVEGAAPAFAWYWTTDDNDAQGNRNYISDNVVATSQPLPVSQPDKYRSAYFADTTTFGGANAGTRYIGCEVTSGETTVPIRSAVKMDDIIGTLGGPISQASLGTKSVTGVASTDTLTCAGHGLADTTKVWFLSKTGGSNLTVGTRYFVRDSATDTFKLAATPGGAAIDLGSDISAGVLTMPAPPKILYTSKADLTFAYYYLTEDVEFSGSGFFICNNRTHLNLNGHKITYNTDIPEQLTNYNFTDGETGWDFTNAPHAAIYAPADTMDAYRRSRLAWGATKSVVFDATQESEYIQSTSTVFLKAGVTYSAAAFCTYGWHEQQEAYGADVSGTISFVDADTGVVAATRTIGNQQGTGNWNTRGSAHLYVEFKPSTSKQYYVRIACNGGPGYTLGFYVSRVLVARARVNGVSWRGYNSLPGADNTWGQADAPTTTYGAQWGVVVRNGTIEEENPSVSVYGTRHGGVKSAYETRYNDCVRMNIIVRGDNVSCIAHQSPADPFGPAAGPSRVLDCVLTNHNTYCVRRDDFYGCIALNVSGTIARNTITHGSVQGFCTQRQGNSDTVIYGNRISLQDKYSNAFAILAARSSKVYDNIITCGSGENSGRGIATGQGGLSAANCTEVYNNIIEVQMLGTMQEYVGGWTLGNYGVQCEAEANYSRMQYIRVFGNVITANGNAYRPSQCIRITMVPAYFHTALDNQFYDNTLNATWGGSAARSSCIYNSSGYECTFTNNTMSTNNGLIILTGAGANITLTGTHIKAVNKVATPTPWMSTWDWQPVTAEFISTTFEDAGSESLYDITTIASEYGGAAPLAQFTIVRTS